MDGRSQQQYVTCECKYCACEDTALDNKSACATYTVAQFTNTNANKTSRRGHVKMSLTHLENHWMA